MHELSKKIAECLKAKCEAKGIDNINLQELDEIKNWACVIKDLTEYDINKRIIEAMDEDEKADDLMEKMGIDRMGYRGRDSRGRFVHRPGRGRTAGYSIMPYMIDGYPDYDMEENYRMGYSNNSSRGDNYRSSSGRTGRGTSENRNIRSGRYGYSYDRYDEARKYYTESKDAESKKEMEESAKEVFEDMEEMVTDIWKDLDSSEKQKYKAKLTQMIQKMQ